MLSELLVTTMAAYKQNEVPLDSICEKQYSGPAVGFSEPLIYPGKASAIY